jgi:hypothetical protein
MPLNLDSCITGVYVPGNIGASSGLPPVVRAMPPTYDAEYDPTAVTYSLDYRYWYNSSYLLLLMV